jgi:hypothetical protein
LLLAVDFPPARDNALIPAFEVRPIDQPLSNRHISRARKVKTEVKGDGQECPSCTAQNLRAQHFGCRTVHFANLYGLFTNSLRKTAVGARPIGEGFAGIQLPPPARKK